MAELQMHPFYRIWLTWVDPLLLSTSIISIFIDPNIFLESFVPASISRVDPSQVIIYHNVAFFSGFLFIMIAGLQRISSDIRVWKTIQAGVLFVDIGLIIGVYASLKQQGRLHPDHMRALDWANFVITAWVALIRICFLAGIGVRSVESVKKRQ